PEPRAGRVESREARILLLRLTEPQARDRERVRQPRHIRHRNGFAVSRRSSAFRCDERLARARRMDGSRARFAILDVPDKHAVERETAGEVEGAVDRIDHPKALGLREPFARTLL